MKKTLITVLITLAAVIVVLFIVIMVFGEDKSAPADTTAATQEDIAEETFADETYVEETYAEETYVEETFADESASETTFDETDLIYSGMTRDELQSIISYDVFDWNLADYEGKKAIVENIHRVWNESGETYVLSTEDTVAFIDANLSDQANIYDIACFAEMIDEAPYHALFQ